MKKRKHDGKKGRPSGNRTFSSLSQHHVAGKTLQPPLRRLDKVSLTSWQDDHLPTMIWAALLTQALPRQDYLASFRAVISHCAPWFADDGPLRHLTERLDDPAQISFDAILDFDSLALVSDDLFQSFFSLLTNHPSAREALRPLLLLSSPAGIARWHQALASQPAEQDAS